MNGINQIEVAAMILLIGSMGATGGVPLQGRNATKAAGVSTALMKAEGEIETELRSLLSFIEANDKDSAQKKCGALRVQAATLREIAAQPDCGIASELAADTETAISNLVTKIEALEKRVETSTAKDHCIECIAAAVALRVLLDGKVVSRHGGQVRWVANRNRALETTLSSTGELRVYLFDENGEPVAADRFLAAGTATKLGSVTPERRQIELAEGPNKGYLLGRVGAGFRPPIVVKLFVNFKDGMNPVAFDFEFKEATKARASPETHPGPVKPAEEKEMTDKQHSP